MYTLCWPRGPGRGGRPSGVFSDPRPFVEHVPPPGEARGTWVVGRDRTNVMEGAELPLHVGGSGGSGSPERRRFGDTGQALAPEPGPGGMTARGSTPRVRTLVEAQRCSRTRPAPGANPTSRSLGTSDSPAATACVPATRVAGEVPAHPPYGWLVLSAAPASATWAPGGGRGQGGRSQDAAH